MIADDATQVMRIERSFDAPAELIWQMWTVPEHFQAWYGPAGATIAVAKMDVRVGGARLVAMAMQTPNATMTMWFAGQHLEVIEWRRLVYSESHSDEQGNVLAPAELGMPPGHPITTEITVELKAVGTRTNMVLFHAGIPQDSPGAMGWAMALDKLAVHLQAQAG